ncbi:MAG: FAD-dependent oxidoreductase [Rhodoferax sp.]
MLTGLDCAAASPWTVLDTDFTDGARFLATWQAWESACDSARMLHYVGFVPPGVLPLPNRNTGHGQALHLALQGVAAKPGFYRLLLAQGTVSLTLCFGAASASMAQLSLQADSIYLCGASGEHKLRVALSKCCKRGTRVHLADDGDEATTHGLSGLGFREVAPKSWTYDPAWSLRRSRQTPRTTWSNAHRCTVIGAGVSGASVARSLALRGWQVQVLDAHDHPAASASGLPAGLVSPVHSLDDGPLSQLTRSGCALMRQHAQNLLVQGQDWEPSGALRQRPAHLGHADAAPSQWLKDAFWLQPAAMVRAWLSTPGLAFVGNARVDRLARDGGAWVCLDASGEELARSELLVVANALDAARLLDVAAPSPALTAALKQMHPMYGGVSIGRCDGVQGLPDVPLQGSGNFLPSVPWGQTRHWLAGAGFETAPLPKASVLHAGNRSRLALLDPKVERAVAAQFDAGEVTHWQGQRCVSHDRLPLAGAVQAAPDASLWISAAMGARGLTLAALCAELLAARIHAEPLPLHARLARLLDAQRLERRTQ